MIAVYELVAAVLLLLWVIFVTLILTRRLFVWMKSRGVEDNVAVYYNRKVIHIFAGGVCASAVPYLFSTSFFPLVMSILLSIFTYIPHKTERLMYWFQTTENMYEVTFTMMWGIVITLGWLVSEGDFLIGSCPFSSCQLVMLSQASLEIIFIEKGQSLGGETWLWPRFP